MPGSQPVALLGAGGTMGFPIARNLAAAGFDVRAWNRSREKIEPLADDGVQLLETPSDAATGAGVLITMLADADAVLAAVDGEHGALAEPDQSMIWAQMSTIGEAATERCSELAQDRGITFVDAPVLGTKQPAEQGQLVVLASGPLSARDRVDPIFDAIGKKTMWVGDAGAGTQLKVATNSWVLTVTEGCAETIALAEGLGLDPNLIFEAVEGGPLDLPYLRIKGKAITERNFEPAFRLELAAKDASLVTDSCERHSLDLPLFEVIRDRLAEGAKHHGADDMSATYLTSAPSSSRA